MCVFCQFTIDNYKGLWYDNFVMKKKMQEKPRSDERLELLFRQAGLTEKQAKIYRLLLEVGEERAASLAVKSGIKRSNTYALLEDLVTTKLASKVEKDGVWYYRPEPPTRVLEIIAGHEKNLAAAKSLAHDLVPQLTTQWKRAIDRPTVRHVEGEEGLYQVFEDIYQPGKKEIHGCVDLEVVGDVFPKHITHELIPRRVKYGMKAWAILGDSPAAREVVSKDKEQIRTSVLFDKTKYPLPAEIEVYEDKIAMMSFARGEFVGLIIENRDFATTLRSIFRYIFDNKSSSVVTGAAGEDS